MKTNYRMNSGVSFEMLSRDQLQSLFNGVLHVLEHIGLDLHHDEARDILKKAGARVEGKRVCIPQHLVKRALSTAPRSFTVFARDGNPKHDIHIGPGRAHFGPGPTPPNFTDIYTLKRRLYVKDDARIVATIVDALPNIDFCESLGTISDVHPDLAASYEFATMFPNTSKPIVAWSYGWDDSADIHKIAVAEAGSQEAFAKRPNYIHYCEPLSPLVSTFEAVDKCIFAAKHQVPLIFTPCPIAGGTAPITAAGIIIQATAESWMGLVLTQTIQPGLPFFMGGVLSIMDMNAMILAYGAPELSLIMAGSTELAHYAGIPLWQTGGCTDSKILDQQAALEGSLSCFFSALSNGDLCHDVGYTESGLTGSILQTTMMDEAIGYLRRITRGIEINEETLATDVIRHVGPEGDFQNNDHTRKFSKTEFWNPNLFDRQKFDAWEAEGKQPMRQRVIERARAIVGSHKPSAVKPETDEVIKKTMESAENRVKNRSA